MRANAHREGPHDRKTDAEDSGRPLAKSLEVGFLVKNQAGKIAETNSNGADPRNIPG